MKKLSLRTKEDTCKVLSMVNNILAMIALVGFISSLVLSKIIVSSNEFVSTKLFTIGLLSALLMIVFIVLGCVFSNLGDKYFYERMRG